MSLMNTICQALELNISDELVPGSIVRVYPSNVGGYDVEIQNPASCIYTADQMFNRIAARLNVLNFTADLDNKHSYLPWFTLKVKFGA
jgi:hypothetical protein